MKKPTFGPIFIAIGLICLLLLVPSSFLTPLISKADVERSATALSPNMFQGEVIQEKMLKDDQYLPIYGSSELSRLDPFHPSNYFKENPDGFTPFLIGRGGTQSIVHFLNFANNKDELKNKKIVFILSPQWFVPNGIDDKHLNPNFSLLQAYDFALHRQISPELQVAGAKRLLEFDIVKRDKLLSTLLEGIVYKDNVHQLKASMVKPFAYVMLKVLERRDLVVSLIDHKSHHADLNPKLTKNVTWTQLRKNAEKAAKRHAQSNPFGVDDRVYLSKIKPHLKHFKNYKKGESYATSPEYHDFQLDLDVLKEAGAKPLFIIIPVNGYWYDYSNVSKKGRHIYYSKVKAQIEKEGFPVADYSGHEYDKYFLKDTLHLGRKSWAYIDQAIYDFWNNKPIKTEQ